MPSEVSRRSFLQSSGAGLAAAYYGSQPVAAQSPSSNAKKPGTSRPNIIFILTDQHHLRGLGCYGGPDVRTPNLDRLAGEGIRFDQAYCQVPVCVPNRSAIFTGRYPHILRTYTNRCPPPVEEPMLPWYLMKAGYTTGGYGKTHFSHNHERGFMETDISVDNYNAFLAAHDVKHEYPWPITDKKWHYCGYVGDSPIPAELSWANWVTNNGIGFVERHKQEPFFLYLGYYGPHPPYQAPKPYADMYDPDSLFLPPRFTDEQKKRRPQYMRNAKNLTEEQLREVVRQYYGLCTHIDECIGRLVDRLDELGLSDNTLIVFSADHGNHLGSYNRMGKTWTLHDSCLRVPWMMRLPGRIPSGQASDAMIQSIDLLPTMLDFAQVDIPERVQGQSRAAIARGEDGKGHDAIFSGTWSGPDPVAEGKLRWGQQCIRTPSHKLITWTTGEQELYDFADDPWEYNNLAGEPEMRDVQYELQQRLATWWLNSQDRVAADHRHPTISRELINERIEFAKSLRRG